MPFKRAYSTPAALSAIQPASRAARKSPSDGFIGLILALGCAAAGARGQEAPPNLARRIAHAESENQAARAEYNYRQTVAFAELNEHGGTVGEYREERDVILSPDHERTEHMIGKPLLTLKRMKLTDEDFADMRGIQPFVMTEDQLWNYETKFRGDENIDGVDCWVMQVRPRQILQGQRLFDGMIWADKRDYSIVRVEGQAVPQILSTRAENLFPRFTTVREKVDGRHWFPVYTLADDTLPFRSGLQRVRMTIRYTQYRRFGAESVIQFGKP
ncbi:MAG: hypothetical protein ABSH50_28325 [Bryobacteraceae bacterium]|jgi:hypothetical protein